MSIILEQNIRDGNEFYEMKNKHFSFIFDGHKMVVSDRIIPVDPKSDSVTFVVQARTIGKDGPKGTLYYGCHCLDGSKKLIPCYHFYRVGSFATVDSVTDRKIVTKEDLNGWTSGDVGHKRTIGIYLSGNTKLRPDHVVYDAQDGAYSSFQGKEITLTKKLPDDVSQLIVPGVTKIWNHRSGGTYSYTAMANTECEQGELKEFRGKMEKEEFSNGYNTFRPGTKFIRMMFLTNWYVSKDENDKYPRIEVKNPHIIVERGANRQEEDEGET